METLGQLSPFSKIVERHQELAKFQENHKQSLQRLGACLLSDCKGNKDPLVQQDLPVVYRAMEMFDLSVDACEKIILQIQSMFNDGFTPNIDKDILEELATLSLASKPGRASWVITQILAGEILGESSFVGGGASCEQMVDLLSLDSLCIADAYHGSEGAIANVAMRWSTNKPLDQVRKVAACVRWDRLNLLAMDNGMGKGVVQSRIHIAYPELVPILMDYMILHRSRYHWPFASLEEERGTPLWQVKTSRRRVNGEVVWRHCAGEIYSFGKPFQGLVCLDENVESVPVFDIRTFLQSRREGCKLVIFLESPDSRESREYSYPNEVPDRIIIERHDMPPPEECLYGALEETRLTEYKEHEHVKVAKIKTHIARDYRVSIGHVRV